MRRAWILGALLAAGCGPDWDALDPTLAAPVDPPTCVGPDCLSCVVADDCPALNAPCQERTCDAGVCGTSPLPEGTPVAEQIFGDCRIAVCDGAGAVTEVADAADLFGGSSACTQRACVGGELQVTHQPLGSPCAEGGGSICDGAGSCVGCVTAADCGTSTPCEAFACVAGACSSAALPVGADCEGGGRCDSGNACVACAPAQSATFAGPSDPLPVIDGDPVGAASTLTVAGLDSGAIVDLNVTANIEHAAVGDLEISLVSPAGSAVVLSRRRGGSAVNAFSAVLFDDDASTRVTKASFASGVPLGSVIPEQSLGRLHGEGANGDWTLRVVDAATNSTAGTLHGWSLIVTAQPGNPVLQPYTFTSGGPMPTPTNSTTLYVPVQVTGVPGVIYRATVTMDLDHSATGEIIARLEAPGGALINLTTQNGGTTDNTLAGTTFDDLAPLLMGCTGEGCVTFTNNVVVQSAAPEGALSSLAGAAPNGEWRLRIQDVQNGSGNTGTLQSWSLTLTPLLCPTTP